jgi:hypothetical protein
MPLLKQYANHYFPAPITLMIPISIRPVGNTEMDNQTTGTLVNLYQGNTKKYGLPVGAAAMHSRLHQNANALKAVKNSLLPKIFFYLIQQTGQAPILYPSLMWTPVQSYVRSALGFTLEALTAVVSLRLMVLVDSN